MNARDARAALCLALVPTTVAVYCLAVTIGSILNANALHVASVACTVLICTGSLATWRKYVRWTILRSLGTAGLTLVVLAHVLLWSPIWAVTGCGMDDFLCTAQSSSAAGLWVAGCGLTWWSYHILRRSPATSRAEQDGRFRMSPSIARLAVGMALIPFLPGLFWVAYVTESYFCGADSEWTVYRAYELCALVLIAVWLWLWRRAVEWNGKRRVITVGLAALLVISPASVLAPRGTLLFTSRVSEVWDILCAVLPLFISAVWLAGTAWTWQVTQRQIAGRAKAASADMEKLLRCPQCRYSLLGLREARCPECGWSSTLDDVVSRSLSEVIEWG